MTSPTPKNDHPTVSVRREGNLFVWTPTNGAAERWCDDHISEDATRWGTCSIIVEHRYIHDLAAGFQNDGGEIVDAGAN